MERRQHGVLLIPLYRVASMNETSSSCPERATRSSTGAPDPFPSPNMGIRFTGWMAATDR